MPWPLDPEAYQVADLGPKGTFAGSESGFDFSFRCYVHKDAMLSSVTDALPPSASASAGASTAAVDGPASGSGTSGAARETAGLDASPSESPPSTVVPRTPIPTSVLMTRGGRHEEYQYLDVVR